MAQKPLDASDTTVRLTLRMTERQTHGLDELRGKKTRSEYMRDLLELAMGQKQLNDVYYSEADHKMVRKPVIYPEGAIHVERKLKVIPDKKHLHRFKEVGEPIRYYQGMPVYLKQCECGETKEG